MAANDSYILLRCCVSLWAQTQNSGGGDKKKAARLWNAQFLCMTKMMSCEELLIFFVGHRDRPLHPSTTSDERMSAKTEARLCPPRTKKVAK